MTFVNPQPGKGVFVFARIAEQVARRRPDIPILVVESRGQASWLEQTDLDLSWAENLHAMANTHDPRDFFRVTKLLLIPSLVAESFGLVAAEAMINGIPVLASNRGALPETIGGAGFLFDIPARYTPETTLVPSVEEVEPWVETIVRLWDDQRFYREWSDKACAHAQRWHPDRLGPLHADFFGNVRHQLSPPFVRKPMNNHDLTSIVIVTHNQLEYTKLCIESIQLHTAEPYELIVVDNGSNDGTVECLRPLGEKVQAAAEGTHAIRRVTVVANTTNRGFPAAANQGIRATSGQHILLLNNDAIVTPGWLTRLLRAIQSDPLIGMVGPVSNFVSGPQCVAVGYEGGEQRVEGIGPEEDGGRVMRIEGRPGGTVFCDLGMLDEFARKWGEANEGRAVETDRLVGFCLLIRREVVDRVGLLDERFGIGNFEDDDYCRRAREAGFRMAIVPGVFVHHFGGRTFIGSGVDHGALMRRNERLYREKWAGARIEDRGLRIEDRSPISEAASDRPLISLCMIARDNERTIGAALEIIRQPVDDIVVVDTGSTDRTAEIAASLGAKVFHFPWCDDFSAARNESIRHASGQWIFCLDTDDVIDEENAPKIRELVMAVEKKGSGRIDRHGPAGAAHQLDQTPFSPTVLGFLMKVRCPSVGDNGNAGYIEVDQVKLFRNLPQLRFELRIHEQILMAIRRAGGTTPWTDIFVVHANADTSPQGRAKKLERDLRILQLDHQEHPDHPFVLFNLGMTLAEASRHQEAVGFLWQSIGRSGDDDSHLRKAFALLVSSYRHLGRQVTAWETCLKGLKQFPDDPELRFRQATMLRDFGNLPDAARAFEDLLALQNGRHLSSVDRGIKGYRTRHILAGIYAELGDFAKAEALWRHVLQEAPSFRPAWRGLGDVLVRQAKSDEALQLVEQMAASNGLARDAHLLRADALASLGNTALARDELDTAIQTNPGDLDLLERRCRLVFEHFPPSDAEPAFRDLIARDPQNAAARHNLGSILYKLRRYDEAATAYREALTHRPNFASTYLHLGYALREAGKRCECMTAWQQAVELEPHNSIALEELKELARSEAGNETRIDGMNE